MPVPVFTTGEVLTAANMNRVGLWKIASVALSTGTTNSGAVFSADFTAYRLIANITGSTGSFCSLRMRSGTTTETGSVYNRRGYYNVGAGPVNYSGTNETSLFFCQYGTTNAGFTVCDLLNPFETKRTVALVHNMDSSVYDEYSIVDTVATTTSYDGFSVIANSGTLAGTIDVYGYRE